MFYLIGEMLLCLLIALLLGFIIGWLIHRMLSRDAGDTGGLENRIQKLENDLKNIGGSSHEHERYDSRIQILEHQLRKGDKHEHTAYEARFLALEKQVKGLADQADRMQQTQPQREASGAAFAGHGLVARASGEKDDLKKIHGIGPVLERILNSHDITTFAQIAAWQDEDITYFAARIGPFRNRIRRDDWVAGAKEQLAMTQK